MVINFDRIVKAKYTVSLLLNDRYQMLKQDFLHLVHKYPVAAAIKSTEDQEQALSSEAALLFVLKGNAFSIDEFVAQAHERGKGVVVHMDLVSGIGKDRAGIQYLRQQGIDAIITSRSHLVAAGHAQGLITIQRLLLLDHSALETGVKTIARAQPDLVEVLPGIIFPDIAPQLRQSLPGPLIAGGFIRTFADVQRIQAAGAILCSSSTQALWNRIEPPSTNSSLTASPH
jgi:glycerol uptake operon antiterminator